MVKNKYSIRILYLYSSHFNLLKYLTLIYIYLLGIFLLVVLGCTTAIIANFS